MNRILSAAVVATTVASLLTSCGRTTESKPPPPPADPTQVAGKPVTEGPSGLRPNAPGPFRPIENTDGGEADHLAAVFIADIEQFWTAEYRPPFKGKFIPVAALFSWDSRGAPGKFCGGPTVDDSNAMFCYGKYDGNCPSAKPQDCTSSYNTIGWDRGVYVPDRRAGYGDMGVGATFAHEYGHAIQHISAKLIEGNSPNVRLEAEQQADCFAGAYVRWVVDGKSPRFTLTTGDPLSKVIATRILVRDPQWSANEPQPRKDDLVHGSAFERVSVFTFGFNDGVFACDSIDPEEIQGRRDTLPNDFLEQGSTGEYPVSENGVKTVVEALTKVFSPAEPPKLSFGPPSCPDARPTPPASYCPSTNTITVDMNRLILMGTSLARGTPLDTGPSLLFGDYTAYSALVSRYMLSVQKQKGGLKLDNLNAGLRTACLSGVATAKFAPGVELPGSDGVKLYAGDLDEAVSGVLTNGVAASNVNGEYAPSGFARVDAFRTGVLGDDAACYRTWS